MLDYALGVLCGAVVGFVAAFFAQGGLLDRRLFLRLCRMPGRWHRQRWLLAGLGALLGVYIVWVQEGFGRGAAGLLLLTGLLLAASVTDLRRRQIHTDCLAVYAVLLFIWQCTGGLWNVLNGALVLYILFGKEMPLTISYEYALVLMALLNVFQDLAFLYYERRAE